MVEMVQATALGRGVNYRWLPDEHRGVDMAMMPGHHAVGVDLEGAGSGAPGEAITRRYGVSIETAQRGPSSQRNETRRRCLLSSVEVLPTRVRRQVLCIEGGRGYSPRSRCGWRVPQEPRLHRRLQGCLLPSLRGWGSTSTTNGSMRFHRCASIERTAGWRRTSTSRCYRRLREHFPGCRGQTMCPSTVAP